MNPKLQALKNAGLLDGDEMPKSAAAEPSNWYGAPAASEPTIQPLQSVNDDGLAQERFAREQEIAALERQIDQLSNDVKGPLLDKIRREQSMAGPGQAPNGQAIGAIAQEVHAEQSKQNAQEAEKIQQQLGGAIIGGAGMLGLFSGASPLAAILTPSHPQLEQEHYLLSEHGVPGSLSAASRGDLGALLVPAGLPAISKEIQMQRNEGFARDITADK